MNLFGKESLEMLLVILVIKGYAGIGWDLIKYDWCPYEKKKIPDE